MAVGALEFRCLRCGKCCTNLLAKDKGVLRGLTILPEERRLFPESMVRPAVGLGKRPHGKDFRVIAFQLTEDTCPHLDNLCSIYPDRPFSCRQFPFSLGKGSDGSRLIGFDLNCPSLIALLRDHPDPHLKFESRPYAERLLEVEMEAIRRSNRAWYFDLRTEKWVKYRDLLKR